MDLFDRAAEQDDSGKPLAERMRPRRLEDFVGQEHVLGPGHRPCAAPSRRTRCPRSSSGARPGRGRRRSPGSSRSAPARSSSPFSAVLGGVKEIREIVAAARDRRRMHRKRTILFVDEIHRFTKAQQDAFLPARRGRHDHPHRRDHREPVLRGERRAPLALPGGHAARAHRGGGRRRCSTAPPRRPSGLAGDGVSSTPDARAGARALRVRRRAARAQRAGGGGGRGAARRADGRSTRADAEEALQQRTLLYDKAGEEHYNVVSAFIKSLRGSRSRRRRLLHGADAGGRARTRASSCAGW